MLRLSLFYLLLFIAMNASSHEARPVHIEILQQTDSISLNWKLPPVITTEQLPTLVLVGECLRSEQLLLDFRGAATASCTQLYGVELNYSLANPGLSSVVQYTTATGDLIEIFSPPSVSRISLLKPMTLTETVYRYIVSGIEHILIGLDHLLFVVCVVMLSVTPKRLILAITGFSIGHSVTLIAASLGVISVPIGFIEWLIALSILVLAAEIARGDKFTMTYKYPVVVCSSFGLMHGLGFASVLDDFGLSGQFELWSLIAFNIGVEVGQIIFVSVLLTLAWFGKRVLSAENLRIASQSVVLLMGVISGYWCIDRLVAL